MEHTQTAEAAASAGVDPELLNKVLNSPELMALLKALGKTTR